MIDDRSFSRMAAIAAIASLPLAAGNLMAMLATVHFNLNGMTNPLVLRHAGTAASATVALEHDPRHLRLLPADRSPDPAAAQFPPTPEPELDRPLRSLPAGVLPHRRPSGVPCWQRHCPTLIREYASATSGSHQVGLQACSPATPTVSIGALEPARGVSGRYRLDRLRPPAAGRSSPSRLDHGRARRGLSGGLVRYGS